MLLNIFLVVLTLGFVVLCTWLVLIILIQPGKSGGGLGGLGGGAGGAISETLGATNAEKSLARWTSWSAAIFFILAVVLTLLGNATHQTQLQLGGGETAQPQGAVVTPETRVEPPVDLPAEVMEEVPGEPSVPDDVDDLPEDQSAFTESAVDTDQQPEQPGQPEQPAE